MHDAVIVGAGIAGLAAAWELKTRGLQAVVLEEQSRAGGVLSTEHTDGFVIDAGADAILSQKLAAIELVRELGLADRLVHTLHPRTAFVLKGGKLVRLPEASYLGLPTRLRPLVATELFSWQTKMRMATEVFTSPRADVPDESIGSFIRRHFGEEAVTYLAEPLLAGIHAGDVEQLSVHALFPRLVEAEQTHGSVLRSLFASPARKPTNGAFVSFAGGIGELVARLVRILGEQTIRYNAGVSRIEAPGPEAPAAADSARRGGRPRGLFKVTLASGESLNAPVVIVAVPAGVAATLVRPANQGLSLLCGGIPYASSATTVFGLRRDQVSHPLEGTGFVVPRIERRTLMAATWVSSKWPNRAPAGHVLLRAFVGGVTNTEVLGKSDFELAQATFDELASLLGITGPPLLTRVYRWPHATPQYQVGHLERIRRIDEQLAKCPGLYVTGSGFRGTGIPDCVSDARATAASAAAWLR